MIEEKELSQPACLPLSYVLRFVSESGREANGGSIVGGAVGASSGQMLASASGADPKRKLAIKHHTYSVSSSNRSNTPTGKCGCAQSLIPTLINCVQLKSVYSVSAFWIHFPKLSIRAIVGSEMEDEDIMVSASEDSNESWTTEEFSSEFIMRYGSRWGNLVRPSWAL